MSKLILFFIFSSFIFAKGTIAGVKIENRASILFTKNSIKQPVVFSNSDSFVIDKIVDIKLNTLESKDLEVNANDKDRVLSFLVSNLGNSKDNIELSFEQNRSSDFLVEDLKMFIDSNNNGIYDSKDKSVNSIELMQDESVKVFLVSNVPESNKTIPSAKNIQTLSAKSSSKESELVDDANRIDTVIRNSFAKDSANLVIRDYWLNCIKSAISLSEDNKTHTNSVVEYKIDCFIDGVNKNREITDIHLKDKISKDLIYVANTLRLNDKLLSDKKDSDEGEYDSGYIVVNVGSVVGSAHKIVKFKTKVK